MSRKGQKYNKYTDEFKYKIVNLRFNKRHGINRLCKMYNLSPENVIKWSRRYLNGEPLTMKKGRRPNKELISDSNTKTKKDLEKEIELLQTELAYKNKVIEYLEKRERLKKKKSSN